MSVRADLVSVVIPTLNSGKTIEACLRSVAAQDYPHVETIVVDGFSTDDTAVRAERLGAMVYRFGEVDSLVYGAPARRNHGAEHASGEFVYHVDSDMVLSAGVIRGCVEAVRAGADAVIVPEESTGEGFWARCKQLERRTYLGDDLIEAPRFLARRAWDELGGVDAYILADDWDLHQRLRSAGYSVARVPDLVLHDEGRLTLARLARKRFVYGRSIARYIRRHGWTAARQLTPLRGSYLRHWRQFLRDPVHAAGFVVMRAVEYGAGATGIASSAVAGLVSRTRVAS